MGGRGGSGRGRVRVRGGRSYQGISMGRGLSGFVDPTQFSGLDSDDNGDNVYVDNKKVRQDKKRQRVSTNSSDDFYQNVDESDMEDSDCDDDCDDDDDDDDDDNDFMRLTMDQKLAAMFTKISATEVKVNSIYKEKLSRRVQKVENVISAHEQRIKLLEYRSIDSEARSRRRNLLFKGIAEYGQVENCFDIVRDFIADRLHIYDDMYLERAHRLGGLKPNQTKPRPIIVAFRDYYDTELILQAVDQLKGSKYSVCRDYPKEITEARNKIWPHYRKARENSANKVSIRYPARLIVNGVTTHDMFPDWFNVLNGSRVQFEGTTALNNVGQNNGTGTQQSKGQQSVGQSRDALLSSSNGATINSQMQGTLTRNEPSTVKPMSGNQRPNSASVNQSLGDVSAPIGPVPSQRQPEVRPTTSANGLPTSTHAPVQGGSRSPVRNQPPDDTGGSQSNRGGVSAQGID